MSYKPVFPEFKNLEISDKRIIDDFTKNFEPYSDFNFVSMFTWDIKGDMEFSFLNDNLVVKFKDYNSDNYFYSFLGDKKVFETINTLLDFSEKKGLKKELQLVPEIVIENLSEEEKHSFHIESDRGDWDYILDSKKLSNLLGSEFHKKRNLVKRFLKDNKKCLLVKNLDLSEVIVQNEIFILLENWRMSKGKLNSEVNDEFKAIQKLLMHYAKLNLDTVGLYINKKLIAFSTKEHLNESEYAIVHYEKAIDQYRGVYEFLNHESSIMLLKKGIKYINFEQDLGVNGLRISKSSYRPVKYLKKYNIKLIDNMK